MSIPEGPGGQSGYPPPPGQPGYPPQPAQPAYPPPPPSQVPPPGPQSYYPVPGQPGYAPPARSRRGTIVVVIIGLALALLVGGFFAFRDRLSGEAAGLQVGNCINLPGAEQSFTEVQHQPCNEAHDAEVIAVLTHPAAPGEAYPVISGFDEYIQQNCVPAFESYVGRDFETDTELELGYFHPTLTSWGEGDRGFTCHVYRVDDAKLTTSVRGGSPRAT